MKERASALFPLALLIILAAATYWLNRVIESDNPRGPLRHAPDFMVDNFKVKRFNPEGRLQHTVIASGMQHFPDDDSTIVKNLHLTYHQQPPTEVFALTALVGRDGKEVDLVDQVRVIRHAADGSPKTILETNTLKVFPDEEKGTTNSPVVITQGQSVMNGSGLDFDNKTSISVLRGRVTGTIHRNQTKTP